MPQQKGSTVLPLPPTTTMQQPRRESPTPTKKAWAEAEQEEIDDSIGDKRKALKEGQSSGSAAGSITNSSWRAGGGKTGIVTGKGLEEKKQEIIWKKKTRLKSKVEKEQEELEQPEFWDIPRKWCITSGCLKLRKTERKTGGYFKIFKFY